MHFSNVLAIAATQSKSEDLRELIVRSAPTLLKVETRSYCQVSSHNIHETYHVAIIEIDTPSATNKTLDIINNISAAHPNCTIFVIVTFSTALSKKKYYIAGADHCIKIVEHPKKTIPNPLTALLSDFYSLNNRELILDQDRMCISDGRKKMEISFIELKVLEALIQSRLLSHKEIASVMGLNTKFYDSRALEKAISRLRTKIKLYSGGNVIQNIRGYGYKISRGRISVATSQGATDRG